MRNAVREFVLSPAADGLTEIGAPRFALARSGTATAMRLTWLDTFDWRLYRAGLRLERRAASGKSELVLADRDGRVLAAEPGWPQAGGSAPRSGRPLFTADLPAGQLRERIAPIVDIRALMPVARAAGTITRWRALDAEDKTVAHVAVEQLAVSLPRQVTAPARLSISPLRGYQAQAAQLARAVAAAPGISRSPGSALDIVLAAAGCSPVGRPGKPAVQLTPSMPGTAALAAVLTALLDSVEANVAGTVRDVDTEFLHDLRVAVRRTRSVLKLAGAALQTPLVSGYRREFKWLGDLTTPTRDLDVFLLGYAAMESALVAAAPGDLRPFGDHLERLRAGTQRDLARGLRSARFSRLILGWRQALADAGRGTGPPAAGKMAARQIARAHGRVLTDGQQITAASSPDQLHDLRKRCKELRYLVEVYASLYEPAQHARAVSELKALQDCLGEFQDTDIQQSEIRDFAEQIMADRAAPAATLLAMGEINAGLAARQQRARDQFAERFAEFSSRRGRARFSALTGAAG